MDCTYPTPWRTRELTLPVLQVHPRWWRKRGEKCRCRSIAETVPALVLPTLCLGLFGHLDIFVASRKSRILGARRTRTAARLVHVFLRDRRPCRIVRVV